MRNPELSYLGRRAFVLVAVALVALAGCGRARDAWHVAAPDPATLRTTPSGVVVGGEGRYGSHAWLGIPYSKPPVGALRWRAPQPAGAWTGTREALTFGAPCSQYTSVFGGVPGPEGEVAGDEDCLSLSVWAPRFEASAVPAGEARLPVLVWIHGGGNTMGAARFYDGGNLAATHGVIVVAVQYRLGPFGWMRHAALRADAASEAEASGNFATLDLVRSLEWVRDHIASFGGDPANVTIFGESAGGTNVFSLLLAPQAHGLFQRAVVQSGGYWGSSVTEAEHLVEDAEPGKAQSSGEILLKLLEREHAGDRAAARAKLAAMSPADVAAFLRSRSAHDLLAAYEPQRSGMIDMPKVFGDGVVLPPGNGLELFASADGWNRVPVVLGTNKDENKLFLFGDPERVKQRLWILPRFVDEASFLTSADYLSRMWKATGADEPAMAMRSSWDQVYVYRFDWDEEPRVLGADLAKMLGASHGFEIPFVFGHFDLGRAASVIFDEENEPGRRELSRAMMSYWAELAWRGAPGRGRDGDLLEWTPWDPAEGGHKYAILDTTAGGGIRMGSDPETRGRVLADLAQDPRLGTPRERCRIRRELAGWGRGFTREQYANTAECADFPFDGYPWKG